VTLRGREEPPERHVVNDVGQQPCRTRFGVKRVIVSRTIVFDFGEELFEQGETVGWSWSLAEDGGTELEFRSGSKRRSRRVIRCDIRVRRGGFRARCRACGRVLRVEGGLSLRFRSRRERAADSRPCCRTRRSARIPSCILGDDSVSGAGRSSRQRLERAGRCDPFHAARCHLATPSHPPHAQPSCECRSPPRRWSRR
jgi:hypothetical protein